MTFSTQKDGVELPYLEGEGELVIQTPPVRLTSDFYLANVAVRERGVGKLLVAQIIAHFHVSDPELGSLSYGVFNEKAGAALRGTFLIDREGVIRWSLVNPIGQGRDFSGYHEALAQLG